jgi:tetratricopeptide (TPR) repeat protein
VSDRDIHKARALVVEPQATLRSILLAQLRDLGVGQVQGVGRTREARLALEREHYDIVVCAREFEGLPDNGQELLDELRREHQLPYGTVFLMLTAQASYHQVVEAGEAALDGLLIRPCSATVLQQRLLEARQRKRELAPVLQALDAGDLEQALKQAVQHWQAGKRYAGWCARLSGELLLRLNRPDDAQKVFERLAAPASGTPPAWALLGVARSLMASGALQPALAAARRVTEAEPGNADAHDVEGRVLVELNQFEAALACYRRAVDITPSCLLRNQHAGALAYHQGQAELARGCLDRAVAMGVQSRLFDGLTLALLAVLRFDAGDTEGLRQTGQQLARYRERFAESQRLQRFERLVGTLSAWLQGQPDQAEAGITALTAEAGDDGFDLEAANLLLGLWARVPAAQRDGAAHEALLRRIGLRFVTGRAMADLLAASARREAVAVATFQQCQSELGQLSERAMDRALHGDAAGAVGTLLQAARQSLNAKTMDVALAIGRRAIAAQPQAGAALEPLLDEVRALQQRSCRTASPIAGLQRSARSPGGLTLRVKSTEGTDAIAA